MPHCKSRYKECGVVCVEQGPAGPTGATGDAGTATSGVVQISFAQPTPDLWTRTTAVLNLPFIQVDGTVTFSSRRVFLQVLVSSNADYVLDVSPPVGTNATNISAVGSAAADSLNPPSVPLILNDVTFVAGRFRLFWRNGSADLPSVGALYNLHFNIMYRVA